MQLFRIIRGIAARHPSLIVSYVFLVCAFTSGTYAAMSVADALQGQFIFIPGGFPLIR